MSERKEPRFVPGERVLIVGAITRPDLNGTETVVTAVTWGRVKHPADSDVHVTDWRYHTPESSKKGCFLSGQLRKLPGNQPATFDASIFMPDKDAYPVPGAQA